MRFIVIATCCILWYLEVKRLSLLNARISAQPDNDCLQCCSGGVRAVFCEVLTDRFITGSNKPRNLAVSLIIIASDFDRPDRHQEQDNKQAGHIRIGHHQYSADRVELADQALGLLDEEGVHLFQVYCERVYYSGYWRNVEV